MFVQLAVEPECPVQSQSLYQFINQQDKPWKDQFIKKTISQIKAETINNTAIRLLHSLVINNASTFSSQVIEEKRLIIGYLNLIPTC